MDPFETRPPVPARPTQLEPTDFDLGGHLVGTPRPPMGAVGQPLQPLQPLREDAENCLVPLFSPAHFPHEGK
jgi:hypothetical protein